MIVVTTESVGNKRIKRTLGLVRGNVVRSSHVGRDILAALRNLVGGEVHEYTKLMAESREHALDRMVDEAQSLGANAIIDVNFSTSYVSQNMAEIMAYGTAVIVEDEL
jgi:uncharacterized protein YbjQ (UPF0145 family)